MRARDAGETGTVPSHSGVMSAGNAKEVSDEQHIPLLPLKDRIEQEWAV